MRTSVKSVHNRKWYWIVVLAIYIVLSALLFSPRLFIGGDNVVYMILAESIVTGQGYTDLHLPEEPPHTKFPVGFPLLLSIPMLLFGQNLIAFKILVSLAGAFMVLFTYKLYIRFFKDKTLLVMGFFLCMPLFYVYSHFVMSEIPYICFSIAAIYSFLEARKRGPVLYYIAFVLAVSAYLLRTAGVALIAAMALILLFRKEYRYFAVLLIVFLLVFIPWHIRNARIPQTWTYLDEVLLKDPYQAGLGRISVVGFIVRMWENFVFYTFTIFATIVLPLVKSRALMAITGAVFLVLSVIGFMKRASKFTVIEIYFFISLAIVYSWPRVWSSSRFLLPLIPFVVIYFFSGILYVIKRVRFRYLVHGVVAFFVILNMPVIVPFAHHSITANIMHLRGYRYVGYMPDWVHYFQIIDWASENVPETSIIMARKPEFVYLLSRRKSFRWPFTNNAAEVRAAFWQSDYVILDNFEGEDFIRNYLKSVIMEERDNFKIVAKTASPPFYLIKIDK